MITEINFNDYAFFKGVSVREAKWVFAEKLFKPENIEKNLTKSGVPIIKSDEYISIDDFDFSMRANSKLEGKSVVKYLFSYYQKGVDMNKLREYSENKSFITALRFTGKHQIVNKMLNTAQLEKLQKTWLLKNIVYKNFYSDNTIKFIINNKWAMGFLEAKGLPIEKIKNQISEYKSKKEK